MDKIYTSLGLMSGTSLDGIDASIISSDGEKVINIEKNQYFPYENDFKSKMREFIENCDGINFINKNQQNYNNLERELTMFHAEISNQVIRDFQNNIDLIGFHGQTIIHKPDQKYSIQMGDGRLLSQILQKKVIYDFRRNDLENNGTGAPLACIYHYNISKKLKISEPVIFLNIGGISNITKIFQEELEAKDIGPGNILIDSYFRKKGNSEFDKDGLVGSLGNIDYEIVKEKLESEFYNVREKHSLDIKDFDYSFIRGLAFNDAVATLTYFTASILSEFLNKNCHNVSTIILCGGGRKNKTLINHLENLTKKNLLLIDTFKLDGDFIESQAFAYLSIRSLMKKNISFPKTTKVVKPITGGVLIKNF